MINTINNDKSTAAAAISGQSRLLTRTWSSGAAKIFQSNPSKTKDSTQGGALEQNYSKLLSTAANTAEKSSNQPASNKSNVAPILLTNIQFIQGIPLKARPLLVLLDSGLTTTLINKRALPFGTIPNMSKQR